MKSIKKFAFNDIKNIITFFSFILNIFLGRVSRQMLDFYIIDNIFNIKNTEK